MGCFLVNGGSREPLPGRRPTVLNRHPQTRVRTGSPADPPGPDGLGNITLSSIENRASDSGGTVGAWVHVPYLHRKESERSNASCRYNRAGKKYPTTTRTRRGNGSLRNVYPVPFLLFRPHPNRRCALSEPSASPSARSSAGRNPIKMKDDVTLGHVLLSSSYGRVSEEDAVIDNSKKQLGVAFLIFWTPQRAR